MPNWTVQWNRSQCSNCIIQGLLCWEDFCDKWLTIGKSLEVGHSLLNAKSEYEGELGRAWISLIREVYDKTGTLESIESTRDSDTGASSSRSHRPPGSGLFSSVSTRALSSRRPSLLHAMHTLSNDTRNRESNGRRMSGTVRLAAALRASPLAEVSQIPAGVQRPSSLRRFSRSVCPDEKDAFSDSRVDAAVRHLHGVISTKHKNFMVGNQNDAHEFLQVFLEDLCNEVIDGKSVFEQMFIVTIMSQITCQKCHQSRAKQARFNL